MPYVMYVFHRFISLMVIVSAIDLLGCAMDEPALGLVAGQVSHDTRGEVRHLDTTGVQQAAQNLERKIDN